MQPMDSRRMLSMLALLATLTIGYLCVHHLSHRLPVDYVASASVARTPNQLVDGYAKPSPFAGPAPPHPSRLRRLVTTADYISSGESGIKGQTSNVFDTLDNPEEN